MVLRTVNLNKRPISTDLDGVLEIDIGESPLLPADTLYLHILT